MDVSTEAASHEQVRLCAISVCPGVIHWNDVLAREQITVEGGVWLLSYLKHHNLDHISETTIWVDSEQMDSFMHEHKHSSDVTQFLKEKKEKYQIISLVCLLFYILVVCPSDWPVTACTSMRQMADGSNVAAQS